MKKFTYLKALFSPFKPFKLKWYVGKTAIGTPYFLPRKWITNPKEPKYKIAVPKKIGFDFVDLGWKIKWTTTDYRFEWAPRFSFVFMGYQLAVTVVAPEEDHYWEAWLYYEYATDKTKSKAERIQECKRLFPLRWERCIDGEKVTTDYYETILKDKYIHD